METKTLFSFLMITCITSCTQSEKISVYKIPKIKREQSLQNSKKFQKYQYPKLPNHWVETRSESMMRLKTYKILGEGKKEKGEISIIELPIHSGSLIDNVNRWREQIGLPKTGKGGIKKQTQNKEGELGQFQFFHFSNEKEMMVCLFELKNVRLFIKLMSQDQLNQIEKDQFINFCQSVKK